MDDIQLVIAIIKKYNESECEFRKRRPMIIGCLKILPRGIGTKSKSKRVTRGGGVTFSYCFAKARKKGIFKIFLIRRNKKFGSKHLETLIDTIKVWRKNDCKRQIQL